MSALLLALLLGGADPLAPLADAEAAKPEPAERLVRRGETVTLRVRQGALTIATPGRALADASQGQRVRVVALSTRRTLDGVVDGRGSVLVAP